MNIHIQPRHILASAFYFLLFAVSATSYSAPYTSKVETGKQLFNQNCAFCHQADAIGKPGMAPSLTNKELLASVDDKFLAANIRDGRPGTSMPPYKHLGMKKINAIVAFLRDHETLPNRAKEINAQKRAKGKKKHGAELFDQICATCHGPEGNGYEAGGSGTAVGKSGFLSKASDGLIRETIKYGRSETRMLPFFGPEALAALSDQDIDDIIVYLRSLKFNK